MQRATPPLCAHLGMNAPGHKCVLGAARPPSRPSSTMVVPVDHRGPRRPSRPPSTAEALMDNRSSPPLPIPMELPVDFPIGPATLWRRCAPIHVPAPCFGLVNQQSDSEHCFRGSLSRNQWVPCRGASDTERRSRVRNQSAGGRWRRHEAWQRLAEARLGHTAWLALRE